MRRSWLPLALCIATFAAPAAAGPGTSCPAPPGVTSYSEAYAGFSSLDSGVQTGDPAVSSVLKGYADPGDGYNFEADSALSIGIGSFTSTSHLGGYTTLSPAGATGFSIGEVTDCLTFGGYQGGAQAHIPIELSGSTFVNWSSSLIYVPANIFDPAYARLMITCAAYSYGSSTLSNCPDPDFIFDTTALETIDTTAELAFPFSFDDPITIQFSPRVTTGFSYASGTGGLLQSIVELQLQGQLLPIYVTDFSGNGMPDVTVSATSGFDYLQPVPEPGTAAAAAAAFLGLAALRRRRSCRALLGMILIGVASPATAQTCDPATATSFSQACWLFGTCGFQCNSLTCFDSGAQAPASPPVSSSVAHTFSEQTVQFLEVTATGAVDVGSFGATAHVSGNTIIDAANRGAAAQVTGVFTDCATAGGYSGPGVLHIPIHLTGSRALTFAPGGYVPPPPPSPPPSYAQLRIRCAAGTVGSGVVTPCDETNFYWDASGDVDTTVELVFGFSFGQPVLFQFSPVLSATVGDPGTGVPGGPGVLSADANVTLTGTLLPAYITDPGGSPLVGATLQANSGFDYLTAPEPPGAWAAAAIALALLRRGRQSFAMIRSA